MRLPRPKSLSGLMLIGFTIGTGATWSLGREGRLRFQAEKAAKASEANFRCLLDAAPDSMVVFRPDGEIVLLNLGFESQFGYLRSELIGKQVNALLQDSLGAPLTATGSITVDQALADRTGAVIAAYHINHDKWENGRALKDAKAHGMSFFQLPRESYIRNFHPRAVEASTAKPTDAGVVTTNVRN